MNDFEHERLDVYRAAIELLALADTIAGTLARGRAYLADQIRRASTSISFTIAEGAGEFASADKARFYRSRVDPRPSPRRFSTRAEHSPLPTMRRC